MRTQCSQDKLKVFKPEEVEDFSYLKAREVLPGCFSLQNRFFLLASALTQHQGGTGECREEEKKAESVEKGPFTPHDEIPKNPAFFDLPAP